MKRCLAVNEDEPIFFLRRYVVASCLKDVSDSREFEAAVKTYRELEGEASEALDFEALHSVCEDSVIIIYS